MLRALIRHELDDVMRLASAADCRESHEVALEHFIDKMLTVIKARNDFEKK